MGLFRWIKGKKNAPPEEAAAPAEAEALEEEVPPDAVVLVREGMSRPTEEDMRAVLEKEAPDLLELPRVGLAQPVWWRESDWLRSGMLGIGRAVREQFGIDPDKTEWRIVKDELGTRVGIVTLFR